MIVPTMFSSKLFLIFPNKSRMLANIVHIEVFNIILFLYPEVEGAIDTVLKFISSLEYFHRLIFYLPIYSKTTFNFNIKFFKERKHE